METLASIDARWVWTLLFSGTDGALEAPKTDYSGILDGMEAAELLALMEQVQGRLKELGVEVIGQDPVVEPVRLYIDRAYVIRMGAPDGVELPLRPLVKTLFILFLRHPEGILLKQRELFRQELEDIYTVISPNTDRENVAARIGRLVNLQDNSFSEKTSVLNARLERLLPKGTAEDYKIQGYNGHPRRIPLDSLMVEWL